MLARLMQTVFRWAKVFFILGASLLVTENGALACGSHSVSPTSFLQVAQADKANATNMIAGSPAGEHHFRR